MRKHISTIIAVLIFITGLSLLLYPTVSECWNSLYQSKVVANYSDKMKKMTHKQKQAAIDAAVACWYQMMHVLLLQRNNQLHTIAYWMRMA